MRSRFHIAAATLALSLYGIAQAFLIGRAVQDLPPVTSMPDPPIANPLALASIVLAVVVYAALGRAAAREGARPGDAARRGAAVGLLAALVSDVAQALLQTDYFRDVLLFISMPDSVLPFVLAALFVVEAILGAAVGAAVSWLAASLVRPLRSEPV